MIVKKIKSTGCTRCLSRYVNAVLCCALAVFATKGLESHRHLYVKRHSWYSHKLSDKHIKHWNPGPSVLPVMLHVSCSLQSNFLLRLPALVFIRHTWQFQQVHFWGWFNKGSQGLSWRGTILDNENSVVPVANCMLLYGPKQINPSSYRKLNIGVADVPPLRNSSFSAINPGCGAARSKQDTLAPWSYIQNSICQREQANAMYFLGMEQRILWRYGHQSLCFFRFTWIL